MRAIDRYASPRAYGAGGWAAVSGSGAVWERTTSLWNTGAFSMCGWAQLDAGLSWYHCLAAHQNAASSVYAWVGYSPSGFCLIHGGGVTQFADASRWTQQTLFWAISSDGGTGAGSVMAYVRLPQDKSFASVSGNGSATTTMVKMTFANDYGGASLACRQWDTRVWDTPLTERELMLESLRPGPVRRSNLRGWYPLKGSYGSSAQQGTVLFDYSDDAAHMIASAGDVRNTAPRYFAVRQVRRFAPLRLVGDIFSGDLDFAVGSGAAAIVGNAPGISIGSAVDVGAGALTLSGNFPAADAAYKLDLASGAATLTGHAPSLSENVVFAVGAGGLSTEGHAPTTAGVVDIDVGAGSAVLSGATPAADVSYVASPGAGALTLDGYAPTAESSRLIDIGSGAATLTGYAADPAISLRFTPDAGALAITGTTPSADVGASREITIPAGVIYTTGYDSRPNQSAAPSPATVSATLSGAAPTFAIGNAAGAGAATITGAAPFSALGLAAGAGTLTLSGAAPTLDVVYALAIPAGGMTTTGLAGTWHVETTAASAALTLSAHAPHVALGVTIPTVGVGVQGLNPSIAITAAIENRAVTLTGEAPGLDFGMPVGSASAAISGQTPTADATRNQYAYPSAGVLTLTGYAPAFELRSLRPDYDEETWSLVVRSEVWMFQIREETATQ